MIKAGKLEEVMIGTLQRTKSTTRYDDDAIAADR
jgi:hypothetical protein